MSRAPRPAQAVADALVDVGVAVILPGELPVHRALEIADGLLAAPIGAVEIIPNGPNTLATLAAFVERARGNMLVGAGRIESTEQLDAVIAAGADFAASGAEFSLPLLSHARQHDFLYIPTVHAPGQTLIARRAGVVWQRIRDDIDTEGLEGLQERTAGSVRYIINQVAVEYVDACFESGAALVCVNDVYLGPHQSQGDIIRRARQARRLWLETVAAP